LRDLFAVVTVTDTSSGPGGPIRPWPSRKRRHGGTSNEETVVDDGAHTLPVVVYGSQQGFDAATFEVLGEV